MSGGKLFWEDFEKRVVGHLTQEHKQLKRALAAVEYWKNQHEKQRRVIIHAYHDHDEMEKLSMCESCKNFFLYDEDNEEHFECECGNRLCGEEDILEVCHPILCSKCEDHLFFACCGTFCDACEKEFCNTCVPHNDDLMVCCSSGCGQIFTYCSFECKEEHQKQQHASGAILALPSPPSPPREKE